MDIVAGDFLTEVMTALNLPRLDQDGRAIEWRLRRKGTGKLLDSQKTLADNDLRESTELLLTRSQPTAVVNDPPEILVEEWGQFFPALKKARERLGNPEAVWYRGQASASYTLLPSLYRAPGGIKHERAIFQKFRQLSGKFIEEAGSDWETLFSMQHYGVPTRLLDWTPVAGIAVFFAISFRSEDDKDCAVFVLDPVCLNQNSGRDGILSSDDKGLSYTDIYWRNRPFKPAYPLALEARFSSERMLVQRGVFTVHCIDPKPLEAICSPCVAKLRLKPSCFEGAKEFLSYANINDATMFPDIQGLANYLRSLLYLGRLTI